MCSVIHLLWKNAYDHMEEGVSVYQEVFYLVPRITFTTNTLLI